MAEPDDLDMLAAEFVLGSLPDADRHAVAARRQREPALEAAISAWEARLAPLLEAAPEASPPDDLFDDILARVRGGGDLADVVVSLRQRLRRWRLATAGIGTIAAALALFVLARNLQPAPSGQSFVAMLQKDAASPAFLVTVDLRSRQLTIRPVAAPPQPGKSYELWLVNDGLKAPRSLGVVQNGPFTVEKAKLAGVPAETLRHSVLAVSLEPEGGSPTGTATGPILFTGPLVQATP